MTRYNKAKACKIYLTQNKFCLVDAEDFKKLSREKWFFHQNPKDRNGYAIRLTYTPGSQKRMRIGMHRKILNAKPGQIVDHINRNTLDNRKQNLRICNVFQNAWNKIGTKTFKGISFVRDRKKNKKYIISRISVARKRIYLGSFKTKKAAFLAYQKAASKFHGEFACTKSL